MTIASAVGGLGEVGGGTLPFHIHYIIVVFQLTLTPYVTASKHADTSINLIWPCFLHAQHSAAQRVQIKLWGEAAWGLQRWGKREGEKDGEQEIKKRKMGKVRERDEGRQRGQGVQIQLSLSGRARDLLSGFYGNIRPLWKDVTREGRSERNGGRRGQTSSLPWEQTVIRGVKRISASPQITWQPHDPVD